MKYVAHRGASKERQENTVEALTFAARMGAFAVECDLRITADRQFVLFHDGALLRMAGDRRCVNELTLEEMRSLLAQKGNTLSTFADLLRDYREDVPVLLDLGNDNPVGVNYDADRAFFKMLSEAPVRFICGVHAPHEAKAAAEFFPPEQILAFMPEPEQRTEFYAAGAGILRLWEPWLDRLTPDEVRADCPDAEVFIMANTPETGLDGNPKSLKRIHALHADGVLLNDIRMALNFEEQ